MTVRASFIACGLAVLLVGCGGKVGGGDGNGDGNGDSDAGQIDPCLGENPPDTCPKACENDIACPIGSYCGDENVCTADCEEGGSECGEGQYCNDRGRCVEGVMVDAGAPGGNLDACPSISVTTEPLIPTVQLLIDYSGSMRFILTGNVFRIDAVRDSLLTPETGIVAQLESVVRFGATTYTSDDGDDNPPCPALVEVPSALDNFQNISDTLFGLLNVDEIEQGNDTPTGDSLDAVAASFPTPGPDERQIIILATDGEPDTCEVPNPGNGDDIGRVEAEDAARRAFADRGIETIILSVGGDVGVDHLQRMANIGVGKDPDEADDPEPFYRALDPDQLVAQFNEIIRGTRECKFTINGEVQDATKGTVQLDGQELELGTDWRLEDESTIELLGEACETYLNAEQVTLDAVFECGSVIIIG